MNSINLKDMEPGKKIKVFSEAGELIIEALGNNEFLFRDFNYYAGGFQWEKKGEIVGEFEIKKGTIEYGKIQDEKGEIHYIDSALVTDIVAPEVIHPLLLKKA